MMKKLFKKGLSVGLTIIMATSMAACGSGNGISGEGSVELATGSVSEVYDEITSDVQSGEHIYKETASMEIDMSYVRDMSLTEDNKLFFVAAKDYDVSDYDVIICDSSLNELERITLKFDASENLGSVCIDNDGYIYAAIMDNSEIYLKKFDPSGNEIKNVDTQVSSDDMPCLDLTDNGIVAGCSNNINLYDRELNYISGDSINSEFYLSSLVYKNGNVLYIAYSTMDGMTKNMGRFDCTSSNVTDSEIIEKDNLNCNVIGDADNYDMVYFLADNIYGYNYGNTPEKIMNSIASGINNNFMKVVQIDPTHIAGYSYDFDKVQYKAVVCEEFDAQGDSRQVITLGGNYIYPTIKDKVIEFNNSNSDYFIAITDYSSYSTTDNFDAGAEVMKNDIIEGNGPDICVFNSQEQADIFEGKNAFVDLSEYMKKDGIYDNILPSVKSVCEKDGKLEGMPMGCLLHGLAMKKSLYDANGSSISIKNIKAIEDSIKKPAFGNSESKEYALRDILYVAPNEFIDYQAKTCNYNSDSFIDLLNYINDTYPNEVSSESQLAAPNFAGNEAAFLSTALTSFRHFNFLEKTSFCEDIVLTGFSLDGGSSNACLYCSTIVAISADAECKDGAYSLIKELLADDFQSKNEFMFPVTLTALNIVAEESTHKIDDADAGFAIDAKENPITKERADYVKEVLMGATDGYNTGDEEISNIINEELAPFFAGDKSAEECADIINQRVGIILSEQK